MHSGNRRPVPSKAALRVLYQLAYISSGTAVGLGVLCTEERRRRTQVVQRVADNAKRIRQSPRYHQNAAALAVAEEEQTCIAGSEAADASTQHSTPRVEVRRQRWRAQDQEGAKGPELPSVVDQGYSHYQRHEEREPAWGTGRQARKLARISRQRHRRDRDTVTVQPLEKEKGSQTDTAPHDQLPADQEITTSKSLEKENARRDAPLSDEDVAMIKSYGTDDGSNTTSARIRVRHPLVRSHTEDMSPALRSSEDETQMSEVAARSLEKKASRFAGATRAYLSSGDFRGAFKYLGLREDRQRTIPGYWTVANEVFDAALRDGQLGICADILVLKHTSSSNYGDFMAQCESFIRACDSNHAYDLVFELFVPHCQLGEICYHALSSDAHEIIALACIKQKTLSKPAIARFKLSYGRVPKQRRGRISYSRTCLQLKSTWQTTRDYTKVKAEIMQMYDMMRKGQGEQGMRQLTLTMLDIQVSANRTRGALRSLQELHQSDDITGEIVLVAAVLFAKRRAWDSVGHLLAIAQQRGPSTTDAFATWKLNQLIHLFGREHDSAATWKFVTSAVSDLGFLPNQTTTEIMLQAFISNKALNLIPQWLRYIKIMGYRFQWDARIALKLVTRYYLDHRPSHVLVMWFCQNLIHSAPSLVGAEFLDLVKEAIGYDIRQITAGGKLALQETRARQRLIGLGEAKDTIPSPKVRLDRSDARSSFQVSDDADSPSFLLGLSRPESALTAVENGAGSAPRILEDGASAQTSSESAKPDPVVDTSPVNDPSSLEGSDKPELVTDTPASGAPSLPEGPVNTIQATNTGGEMYPPALSLEDLRPSYTLQRPDAQPALTKDPSDVDFVEGDRLVQIGFTAGSLDRDMILALSLKQYDKVLALYEASVDAVGLPPSPLVLEVAIQACLCDASRGSIQADKLMTSAREAGMNVTCALGPILMHRINSMRAPTSQDAEWLHRAVLDYYRMNEENGWPVKHHVSTAAADFLIMNGLSGHGVDLLNSIYRSDWAAARPIDISVMTMFIKGYSIRRSREGIRWAVKTVLDRDLRIDQLFLRSLKFARLRFTAVPRGLSAEAAENTRKLYALARLSHRRCLDRRDRQRFEVKKLGNQLVACIAKSVNAEAEPVIDTETRLPLEEELFGKRSPSAPALPVTSTNTLAKLDLQYYRRKARLARSISVSTRERKWRRGARVSSEWLKQYRAYLRKDMVLPDGRLTAFKYRMPPEEKRGLQDPERQRRRAASAALSGTAETADAGYLTKRLQGATLVKTQACEQKASSSQMIAGPQPMAPLSNGRNTTSGGNDRPMATAEEGDAGYLTNRLGGGTLVKTQPRERKASLPQTVARPQATAFSSEGRNATSGNDRPMPVAEEGDARSIASDARSQHVGTTTPTSQPQQTTEEEEFMWRP